MSLICFQLTYLPTVTAAFPLCDFFLSTFLITFVFLHAHFAYVFAFFSLAAICILLDFSHNSALFNFIRKSFSKKLNIGVSESIRLTSIPSLRSSFSFSVLRARKSHNVCKCLSLFCVFLFLLLCNNL